MIALDTNILVYAESKGDIKGRDLAARQLMISISLGSSIVSLQVFCEFLNICRRKRLLSMDEAIARVEEGMAIFQVPTTTATDIERAAHLSARFDLQYFDALIIAIARRAGATILLSEDMQDGLEIEGLRVINPFVAANDATIAAVLG